MAVVRFNFADFNAATEKAINAGVTAAAMQASVQMKGMLGRGGRLFSAATGRPPNSQTGRLHRSITSTRSVNRKAEAGTNVVYGRTLEHGGTVTAKKGKFLAVPLNPAARRESEKGVSLRSTPRTIMRTKTGKLLLISQHKTRGSVTRGAKGVFRFNHEPVFLLTRSVKISPHPFVQPAVYGAGKKSPIIRAAVRAATKALGKFATSGLGGSLA